ncbi:unnamed protein product [Arctogadus glacialis]
MCSCKDDATAVVGQYQYRRTTFLGARRLRQEPLRREVQCASTAIKSFVLIPGPHQPGQRHHRDRRSLRRLHRRAEEVEAMRYKHETSHHIVSLGGCHGIAGLCFSIRGSKMNKKCYCSYLPKKNRKNVRLLTDARFKWLIGDDRDTTVRESTDCAYDRIVVEGNTFPRLIVPGSAEPFLFPAAYGLTEEQALKVSDHYPVQVSLRSGPDQKRHSLKSGPPPGLVLSPPLVLAVCWLAFS